MALRTSIFRISWLAGAAGMLMAAGCEVGPDYKPPKVTVSQDYKETGPGPTTMPSDGFSHATPSEAPITQWWTTFNDKELDSLITRAVRSNLDLKSAASRLRQARAQRAVVGAEFYPQLNADGGYQYARGSKNVVLPLSALTGSGGGGGAGATVAPGAAGRTSSVPTARPMQVTGPVVGSTTAVGPGPAVGGPLSPLGEGGFPGVDTQLYQAGFDASWEIDVFGGVHRNVEAASADMQAAMEDRRDVMISIMAEVARDYIDLRATQRELQIAQATLRDQTDTLRLTQDRYRVGFATDLDVARQAAQVATTSATIPGSQATERQLIHAIGVLLGQDPDSLTPELTKTQPIPPVPPEVPIGVPSELLRRRPDIRRAERQLAAATARIGAAEADLYPKFSITGSFGLDSTQVKHLFDWSSRYFLLSPGINWPIFDAGRIRANVMVQQELTRQAATNYQEAVLDALREVEDALAQYRTEQLRQKALADAVEASQTALTLAEQQYQQGVIDFLQVLDTERTLLSAQDNLAESQGLVSTDLVALYKALGGGWEVASAAR